MFAEKNTGILPDAFLSILICAWDRPVVAMTAGNPFDDA